MLHCSGTYDKDVEEGNGREWLKCTCGRWLNDDCASGAVDLEEDATICPLCRCTEMLSYSMSLAAYFMVLFELSYGDCWELWAVIQHVEVLGDIGYLHAVDITYRSLPRNWSRVSGFY